MCLLIGEKYTKDLIGINDSTVVGKFNDADWSFR